MSNKQPHILIVDSPYYTAINEELVKGCIHAIESAGATFEKVSVPGALEMPLAVLLGFETGKFDGAVALGCVIRGETSHYDIVVGESARGIADLALAEAFPIGNAILTVETKQQAQARADSQGMDKGGFATNACLQMVKLKKYFDAPKAK